MNISYLKINPRYKLLILDPIKKKKILRNSNRVFSYIDRSLGDYEIKNAKSSDKEREVCVCELKKEGNLIEIFSSQNKSLEDLTLSQSQIINFARKFNHCLARDGNRTYFLIEDHGRYYVIYIMINPDGSLGVGAIPLNDANIIRKSSDRFVIPL